jgi:uncharacterized protein (DUF427 family)
MCWFTMAAQDRKPSLSLSKYYVPRGDAHMSLLVRTTRYTYCPYKGDYTYYSIPIGGTKSKYAVWTCEKPYKAVADIRGHLAFYSTRFDAIEVIA